MERSIQFRRTDRAIIDATIRLLREKSFEEITVQNILDETPVTRATFYAHFHDKYEVAERMQQMYVEMLRDIPLQMADVDRRKHPKMIQHFRLQYRDIVEALLKIRTERVDIRSLTAQMHKTHYLSQAEGSYAEAEAEIYAQAMTALQLSYLDEDNNALNDEDFYDKVMVSVFLRILRLEKEDALRQQIFAYLPSNPAAIHR